MAKCYLLIEDLDVQGEGMVDFQHAADFGMPEGEVLPDNVEALTPAQYCLFQFVTILRGMGNDELRESQAAESKSQILLPNGAVVPQVIDPSQPAPEILAP